MSESFDPNAASQIGSGIFGLTCVPETSAVIYLPIPWEVTTSYGRGTKNGPNAILKASRQIDLFDPIVEHPYEAGLYWAIEPTVIEELNEMGTEQALKIIELGGDLNHHPKLIGDLEFVNKVCSQLNETVFEHSLHWLNRNKMVALVGGDHASPFGAYLAASQKWNQFGLLHFDAHSDTRKAFEGFVWSHASIMYNALENIPQISKIVQVGIRDYCEEESDYLKHLGQRATVFTDPLIKRRRFLGESFHSISNEIIQSLPMDVWITFDIDCLDESYCPNTGTPVPGGLSFSEALYIIEQLVFSGRRIIGLDLVEVAPDPSLKSEWDANVGARLLYKMSSLMLASSGRAKLLKPLH